MRWESLRYNSNGYEIVWQHSKGFQIIRYRKIRNRAMALLILFYLLSFEDLCG